MTESFDINKFVSDNRESLSNYFEDNLLKFLQEIQLHKNPQTKIGSNSNSNSKTKINKITFKFTLDESCLNGVGTVHGGCISTLIENLINSAYFHFSKKLYKTLDSNINYLNPIVPNTPFTIEITLDRAGARTSFAEAKVTQNSLICSSAALVKTYLSSKF